MSTSPLKQCYAYGRVSFCVDMHDGCRRGMRRRGKRYRDCCVTQVSPWGGGSLMLWGGISWRHQTPFVVVDSNISARRYNATRYWNLKGFRSCEITLMFYNSRTMPDLKPMQHISDQMGRRVYSRSQPPVNQPQLLQSLNEERNVIPQHQIRRLIRSMRRRCQATIDANGGHTRF